MRVLSHPQDTNSPPSSPSLQSRRSPSQLQEEYKDHQKLPFIDSHSSPHHPPQPGPPPLPYSYSPPAAYYLDSRWRGATTLTPAVFHPQHVLQDPPTLDMSRRVAESGERSSNRRTDDRTQYDIDHSPNLRITHHSPSIPPATSSTSSSTPPPHPQAFYAPGPPVHPGTPYAYPPPYSGRYQQEQVSAGAGAPPPGSAAAQPYLNQVSTRAIIPAYVPSQSYPGQATYVIHTDDAATKLSDRVRRKCYNCRTTDTSTWRRSNLVPGKVLCNKCGLFERTHSRPRPEQFPHKRVTSSSNTPPPSSPGRLPPISTYIGSLPPASAHIVDQQQQHPHLVSRHDVQTPPQQSPKNPSANGNGIQVNGTSNGSPYQPHHNHHQPQQQPHQQNGSGHSSRNSPEIRNLLNDSAPPPAAAPQSTSVSTSSSPRPASASARPRSPEVQRNGVGPSVSRPETPSIPEKVHGQKRPASPGLDDDHDSGSPPSQRPRTEPRSPQYAPRAAI
ncbi:hypothetical protein NLI96_g9158 [Meripilus lineatus]|uniref:GATA-type domain-containing protein n=1 Tax=Meripilus lineatus TaxID=2056292 RepID=A0AAD5UXL8_9APHY|nr:hypothetical protein NLI96_g9158 [Physisporinus lineatus]